jgi:hypothetical protein
VCGVWCVVCGVWGVVCVCVCVCLCERVDEGDREEAWNRAGPGGRERERVRVGAVAVACRGESPLEGILVSTLPLCAPGPFLSLRLHWRRRSCFVGAPFLIRQPS